MKELIKVASQIIGVDSVQTVNGRDLHTFLENGDHFAQWMKDRISQYGFIENQDFVSFSENTEKGRPRIEYALTLDMAKELSMVERNEKGKQARQYFLECERKAKAAFYQTSAVSSAITNALKLTPAVVRAARALGLDKNAAAISANQLVNKLTHVNLLAEFGHTHLVAENQEVLFFTPTELGKRVGTSGRVFNMLLAEAGLQTKQGDTWTPTDTAEGFFRIYDTGKRHGSGVPVQQIKWAENVLNLVKIAA